MKAIWKFNVTLEDSFCLEMPVGAEILTIQMQGESAQLWAICNTEAEKTVRYFEVFGTGHEVPVDGNRVYISTIQLLNGNLVFHIFEKISSTGVL